MLRFSVQDGVSPFKRARHIAQQGAGSGRPNSKGHRRPRLVWESLGGLCCTPTPHHDTMTTATMTREEALAWRQSPMRERIAHFVALGTPADSEEMFDAILQRNRVAIRLTMGVSW